MPIMLMTVWLSELSGGKGYMWDSGGGGLPPPLLAEELVRHSLGLPSISPLDSACTLIPFQLPLIILQLPSGALQLPSVSPRLLSVRKPCP